MTGRHSTNEPPGESQAPGPPQPPAPGPGDPTADRDRRLEIFGGFVAIVLAFVGIGYQVRDRHDIDWTVLILLLVVAALVCFFMAWVNTDAPASRHRTSFAGVVILIVGVVMLVVAPTHSPGAGSASKSTSPTPTASSTAGVSLATQMTVPDMTGRCSPGGIILQHGSDPYRPTPGKYALTAGAQLSVVLQSADTSDIVVTHIQTAVDGRSEPASGTWAALPAHCQGVPDKDYYLADFANTLADLKLNPGASQSDALPITVSSQDPVIVYILMPNVTGSVSWHLEITWILDGKKHLTIIRDAAMDIATSAR